MKLLVTGGAGFIGHHLVHGLLRRGHDVAVIDDLVTGEIRRITDVLDQIAFVEGSVLRADALDAVTPGCEVILHQAALPSVARSVRDPRRSNEVNTSGTIEVMLAATRHGVRRVVLAGSSSVYGSSPEMPRRETQRPSPQSPYAVSKLAAEHYLHTIGALTGVETVALRYFNVFGPGQDPASEYAAVVPRFVTAVLRGEPPVVNGTGEASRDFTYVENVVEANVLAATASDVSGLTCNIGCGTRFTLLELLEAIGTTAGRTPRPTFGAPRPGDVLHSQADIALARERLGYEVAVPFHSGVTQTVAWFDEAIHGQALSDG